MAKLSFVFLLLLSSTLVGADCQFFDGTKSVKVLEGQAVSLRDPGKSLEKLKIQDQDGLNTCYANTTSVILKSLLPNQPDVSYTHAAVMGTTRGWEEDWSKPDNVYKNKVNKNDNFTGYGWVCDTIAGLKNAGGACPKNLSAAEGPQVWDSDIQQRLFNGLSLYFDNVNKIKTSPVAMAQLKKDLSLAIEAINVESAALVQQCEDRKSSGFPVFGAVKNLLEEPLYDQISDPSLCNQARVAEIKKLVTAESIMEKDRFDITPNAETLAKFQSMIENDPLITKDLESYLNTPNASLDKYPALVENFGKKFNTLLQELVPEDVVKIVCKELPAGQSSMVKESIEAQAKTFIYAMEYNKRNPCKDLLHAYDLDDLFNPVKNPKACLAPTNVDMILAAMKPLLEIEAPMNESLLPTLLNPESRYADQIVRAIMPGCLDQSKLIPVKDLACSTFPVCDPSGGFDDASTYEGPKGGCHSLDQARKLVRTKTLIGINQGRALGIAVCTAFLNNPDIKSNFCRDGLPEGKRHNSHEVTLTGYRCKADQIEYEIVNSWGSSCTDNKNVECQKDEDENPTGPFWVKEEVLVDNTTDMSAVTVKKK